MRRAMKPIATSHFAKGDSVDFHQCGASSVRARGRPGMLDLNISAPGKGQIARRIAVETLVSIGASLVLTCVAMALIVGVEGDARIKVAAVWRMGLLIATIAPAIICPVVAFQMTKLMQNLRQTRDELASLVQSDPLTRLLNRRGFGEAADAASDQARRSGRSIAALMCDIDMFKAINDQYGHEFGDVALLGIAQIIRASMGNRAAVLGRQGGEEFAILLPGVAFDEAAGIAERLRAACFDHPFACLGQPVRITVSIGVAANMPGENDWRALLARADSALYQAKREGRNRVVCATEPARLDNVA
jgi:diguanylate cyclase (GGDEF)-like protein